MEVENDKTYSVCALIIHPVTNKILAISRKDDHNDFGLIGGKVDLTDPNLEYTLKREVFEETGLFLTKIKYFFSGYDELERRCVTYICEIEDYDIPISLFQKNQGVVNWVDWEILENGSFKSYNTKIKDKLEILDFYSNNIGVIVGRFQVPFLHKGHIDLIKRSLDENKRTIIFIGDTKLDNEKNIFEIEHRKKMIQYHFKNYSDKIFYESISDFPTNELWSKHLDLKIETTLALNKIPNPKIFMYGGRDSFLQHYIGGFKKNTVFVESENISGTEIRAKYLKIVD